MRVPVYRFGRTLQVAGLGAMPFSLWVGWIGHNESGSITIFLGSIAVFYAGYLLTQLSAKL
jgi:hypothetical protein